MSECEHDFIPVKLTEHPNNPTMKIVWVVCKKCYCRKVYFSKELR